MDTKKSAARQRHHYVPRTYLRRFTWDDGLLHVYRVGDPAKKVFTPSVENILHERGLYDFSRYPHPGFDADWVEGLLATFDDTYNQNAITSIDISKDPTLKEATAFALFGFHQFIRTPRVRDQLFENAKKQISPEEHVEGVFDNFGALVIAGAVQFFPQFISDIELIFHRLTGFERFLTTDHPVSQWDIETFNPTESLEIIAAEEPFANKRYLFPLSPLFMLEMRPRSKGHGKTLYGRDASDAQVAQFNEAILSGASDFIVLPPNPNAQQAVTPNGP
jgi:hypothetical protein